MAPAAAVPLPAAPAPRRLWALYALGLLAGPARAADVASRVGAQSLVVGADAAVSPSGALPASRQMRREHPGAEEPRGREAGAARWGQVKQELQQRLQQQLTQLQYQPVEQQQEQPSQPQSQPQSLLQESQLQPAQLQAQQAQQPLQQPHQQQQQVQQQELPQAQLQLQQAQPSPPMTYSQYGQPLYNQPVRYAQPPPVQYSPPVQYAHPPAWQPQYAQPPPMTYDQHGHPHYAARNPLEAQQEVNDFDAVASRAIAQSGMHPTNPPETTTQPCIGVGPCEDVETAEEDITVYLCIIGVAVLAVAAYCYRTRHMEEKSGGPQKAAAKS